MNLAEQRIYKVIKFFGSVVAAAIRHRCRHPQGVFLLMTPEHGNLGDHALAYAETRMLKQLGIPYFEITSRQVDRLSRLKLLRILNGYPILLNGGGYLGTLWPEVEQWTRDVIRSNSDSPIMILPNTIYYPDTPEGHAEAEKSAEIYNGHPNLRLYARERTSYEKMRSLYKKVTLMPDMVLSLDGMQGESNRSGCILSLRQDCEKTRTVEDELCLRSVVKTVFGDNVMNLDMVKDAEVLPENREKALQEQFDSFRSAQLVITDRLHGMIFSALTETPCIVIDSKSPKVRGCYEWIRNLGYIRFADSPEQIPELYRTMPQQRNYSNEHLRHYYEILKTEILSFLVERA